MIDTDLVMFSRSIRKNTNTSISKIVAYVNNLTRYMCDYQIKIMRCFYNNGIKNTFVKIHKHVI